MFRPCSDTRPFIIAEVGQNHQGDISKAIEYIKTFSKLGADAIKFQIRDNAYLFSQEAYGKDYNSTNSFGQTYGEHREKLELSKNSIKILKEECLKNHVYFMCTPFDEPSLDFLVALDVDILKISSFDLGNIPFINKIAQAKIPVVMSTGGGKDRHVRSSVSEVLSYHDNLAILHCVSEYPCNYDILGLDNIGKLKREFPKTLIGLSDHFSGTLSGPVAYMKGARVFEKHVTFNRAWKGTDHSFALEPEGFRKFSRDIHRVSAMMKPKNSNHIGEEPVFKKLGKSIIASKPIKKGDIFTRDNLSGRIFPQTYTPVRESNILIGGASDRDYSVGDPIILDGSHYNDN